MLLANPLSYPWILSKDVVLAVQYKVYLGKGSKKKVRNFPHFSGVGGFEKVIFRKRKKNGLKMHKIT